MKLKTLTFGVRGQSRDRGNLAKLTAELITLLTEDGPVLQPGTIWIRAAAFETILPACLWTALLLHECGRWGACNSEEISRNDEALTAGGTVVSRWSAQDGFEFTVETSIHADDPVTTVSVPPDVVFSKELGLFVVRLGDVVIDGSLYSVPLNQIWFALREHEQGSPGDTDLFPRISVFRPGSTVVSWWTQPHHADLPFRPFWVLTHMSEPRITQVFAGSPATTL